MPALAMLIEALEGAAAEYEVVEHPRTETARAEARALGLPADDVAKTLVVKTPEGYLRVVLPASRSLDLRRLRAWSAVATTPALPRRTTWPASIRSSSSGRCRRSAVPATIACSWTAGSPSGIAWSSRPGTTRTRSGSPRPTCCAWPAILRSPTCAFRRRTERGRDAADESRVRGRRGDTPRPRLHGPRPLAGARLGRATRGHPLAGPDPRRSRCPARHVHALARLGHRPGVGGLAEGERPPREGRNDFGTVATGALPAAGHGPHRYRFRLHALDAGSTPRTAAPGTGSRLPSRATCSRSPARGTLRAALREPAGRVGDAPIPRGCTIVEPARPGGAAMKARVGDRWWCAAAARETPSATPRSWRSAGRRAPRPTSCAGRTVTRASSCPGRRRPSSRPRPGTSKSPSGPAALAAADRGGAPRATTLGRRWRLRALSSLPRHHERRQRRSAWGEVPPARDGRAERREGGRRHLGPKAGEGLGVAAPGQRQGQILEARVVADEKH